MKVSAHTTIGGLALAVSCLFAVAFLAPARAAGEVVVVANGGVEGDRIDRRELQRIYLGKRSKWEDGSTVVPVILKEGPVHEEFVEEVVGRSVYRFANYWRQMVFTGQGAPPRSLADESEVVDFVQRTPGAVGYVSPQADVAGVKVLAVD